MLTRVLTKMEEHSESVLTDREMKCIIHSVHLESLSPTSYEKILILQTPGGSFFSHVNRNEY